MARIEGRDPAKTPLLMRQVFKKVRKMLGRDLTAQKITAPVPRVFWTGNGCLAEGQQFRTGSSRCCSRCARRCG